MKRLSGPQRDALKILRRGVSSSYRTYVYQGNGIRKNTARSLARIGLCRIVEEGSYWRASITQKGLVYTEKAKGKRKKKEMPEEDGKLSDEECALLYRMGTRQQGTIHNGGGIAKNIVLSLEKKGFVSVINRSAHSWDGTGWTATLTPLGFECDEASL